MSNLPILLAPTAEGVRQCLADAGFEVEWNSTNHNGNGVTTGYEFEVVCAEAPTRRVWVDLDLKAQTAGMRFGEQFDTAWAVRLDDADFENKVLQFVHECLGSRRPAASDQ